MVGRLGRRDGTVGGGGTVGRWDECGGGGGTLERLDGGTYRGGGGSTCTNFEPAKPDQYHQPPVVHEMHASLTIMFNGLSLPISRRVDAVVIVTSARGRGGGCRASDWCCRRGVRLFAAEQVLQYRTAVIEMEMEWSICGVFMWSPAVWRRMRQRHRLGGGMRIPIPRSLLFHGFCWLGIKCLVGGYPNNAGRAFW